MVNNKLFNNHKPLEDIKEEQRLFNNHKPLEDIKEEQRPSVLLGSVLRLLKLILSARVEVMTKMFINI